MKKGLVFLVVLVLVLSFLGLAEAKDVLQVNEAGEVESIEIPETFRSLTESEMKAFNNPGQEVPMGSGVVTGQKKDFWYVVPITTYNQVVVFSEGTMQTISKDMKVSGKPTLVIYIVLCLVAIGCMVMSNAFKWRGDSNNNTAFAALALVIVVSALATTLVAVLVADFTPTFVASLDHFLCSSRSLVAACVAALAAVVFAAAGNNNKAYWIASLVFYICIVVVMFI